MRTWQAIFEKVIVPVTGWGAFVYASSGGPVPIALYPLIGLAIGLPGLRWLDRLRSNGNDE